MTALTAKFIIEIMGRPVEHLEKSLSELIDKMGSEKGTSILHKEIHKTKKVEKVDNLWTTFADVEMKFETLPLLFNAIMTYLPAHIEVYEPESLKLNIFEINEFANFVVGRLHNYDALAKRMMSEQEILISKLEYLRKGGDPKLVFNPPQQEIKQEPNLKGEKDKKTRKKLKKKSKKK